MPVPVRWGDFGCIHLGAISGTRMVVLAFRGLHNRRRNDACFEYSDDSISMSSLKLVLKIKKL